jgi:hypothetical protein
MLYARVATTLVSVLLITLSSGCDSPTELDLDMARFERISELDSLDFGQVEPSSAFDYWELRFSWGHAEQPDRVIGAGGVFSRSELSPEVRAAVDALAPPVGFAIGCLPGLCFMFVAAVEGDQVMSFTTTSTLRDFLGEVGSPVEAALLVRAHGFWWEGGAEHLGYRSINGGWEFVVTQLVRDCTPVQTDRVLLRVTRAGEVRELGREVWHRDERACV